jgi:hypothetical protein
MIRFDPPALFKAMDAQREGRGLSWQDVAQEIGVSASTITRTREQGRFEVDGVLAMSQWLGRRIEDFSRRTML